MASSSSSIFWRLVPFAAVAAIGFGVGRFTAPRSDAALPDGPSSAGGSATVHRETGRSDMAGAPANRGPAGLSPEEKWRQWASAARSREVERELGSALEEMARTAPERALDLAAKERNLRARERLRQAALRGWAATAPDAALAAAMKLPAMDNRAAIEAVLQGAAANPATVLRLGRQIADGADPVALDYGSLAIAALADHGHFEDAVRFAADGPPSIRAQWLNAAFMAWAREQPDQAFAQLQHVTDPTLRHEALSGLVAGWADSDPGSLAEHALHEPAGDDRAQELSQTLMTWVLRDPAAASQWLSQRDADPALDSGLAAVALLPALVSQRPEVAVEWAQAISDSQQRQFALHTIGEDWRRRAPAALQQFLQRNSRLSESDRAALGGSADPQTPGP